MAGFLITFDKQNIMTFALITEGISENKVLKHFLSKFFKDFEPDINQIQPKLMNKKQENEGGWNEVLKYCENQDLKDILLENDFLIIQIDTDLCQTKPFDISHFKADNIEKTQEELYNDVKEKLISLIKPEIFAKYKANILFAICIHSIECWLLPIYFSNNKKTITKNCLNTLNSEIVKKDLHIINKSNKNNHVGQKSYESILKNVKKKSDVELISSHNHGFSMFVKSLEAIYKKKIFIK